MIFEIILCVLSIILLLFFIIGGNILARRDREELTPEEYEAELEDYWWTCP